jgi:hypothetical protein
MYKMDNIDKAIKVRKGMYNIETLLNELNQNEDLNFSVDIQQKITIKSNNNFVILPNNFTNKLGFNYIPEGNITTITASRIYDLRPISKLYLFIKNINSDKPVSILNFNGTGVCDLKFNEPITLSNLDLQFYTDENALYDFNEMYYNLSFIVSIVDNSPINLAY